MSNSAFIDKNAPENPKHVLLARPQFREEAVALVQRRKRAVYLSSSAKKVSLGRKSGPKRKLARKKKDQLHCGQTARCCQWAKEESKQCCQIILMKMREVKPQKRPNMREKKMCIVKKREKMRKKREIEKMAY